MTSSLFMSFSFSSSRPVFSAALAACLFLGPVIAPMAVPALLRDAEAAGSRDKRKIKKLKKKSRKLKKRVRLYAGRRPVPLPAPFIELVTVGNAWNAPDPLNSGSVPGIGAVAAAFQIGKYEVTNAQYVVFLNVVAAEDPNGLFNAIMEPNARGGITQFGTSPNLHYATKPFMADKQVNFVSFWDACRFCNWLHNGMPSGAQDNTTTEDGAYTLASTNPTNDTVDRNPGAQYFLPTEDQWYKAAYPRPLAAGGDTDDYWLYPTGSNAVPTEGAVTAIGEITNDDENIANYSAGADWDSNGDGSVENGNVTTVGSGGGAGSASAYGAFDMGGNVLEWNEAISSSGSHRGQRGGSWGDIELSLLSSSRFDHDPDNENSFIGFRVASP